MSDARDAETILPLLLDRYRVEGLLGEGGLGTVVKAYDTRLKRHVAIKTLKHSLAADVDLYRHMKERFVREAEAGSRMGGNPHVVTVHDLATDDGGTLYLVQEFVPGGSVADRIARGPLPVAEALAIAADAAEGLQAAHEKGIVHRDIKPANLFLAEDGRALVGDFGIAQVDDVSARTHAATGHPGTPLYMSPEQQQQSLYVRPASDQYSLGLVLFEMLTGVGYKRVGVRAATTLLAAQPEAVAALVARMIEGHPDDRFPAMAAVMKEAERIAREIASPTTKPATARMAGDAHPRTYFPIRGDIPSGSAVPMALRGTVQQRTPVIPPNAAAPSGIAPLPSSQPVHQDRRRSLAMKLVVAVFLATVLGGSVFVLSRSGGTGASSTATFAASSQVAPVAQSVATSAATVMPTVPAATAAQPPAIVVPTPPPPSGTATSPPAPAPLATAAPVPTAIVPTATPSAPPRIASTSPPVQPNVDPSQAAGSMLAAGYRVKSAETVDLGGDGQAQALVTAEYPYGTHVAPDSSIAFLLLSWRDGRWNTAYRTPDPPQLSGVPGPTGGRIRAFPKTESHPGFTLVEWGSQGASGGARSLIVLRWDDTKATVALQTRQIVDAGGLTDEAEKGHGGITVDPATGSIRVTGPVPQKSDSHFGYQYHFVASWEWSYRSIIQKSFIIEQTANATGPIPAWLAADGPGLFTTLNNFNAPVANAIGFTDLFAQSVSIRDLQGKVCTASYSDVSAAFAQVDASAGYLWQTAGGYTATIGTATYPETNTPPRKTGSCTIGGQGVSGYLLSIQPKKGDGWQIVEISAVGDIYRQGPDTSVAIPRI